MNNNHKKQQILNAALGLFSRYGYKKTTVEDVAAELGMTKGNLYLYVKNKRDLYEQAVAQALRGWQAKVAARATETRDPSEKFVTLARAAFECVAEDRNLQGILLLDPDIFTLSEAEDRFADINRDSVAMLAGVITEGIAAGTFGPLDAEVTASFLFSVYIMFIIKICVRPEGAGAEAMFEAGLALAMRGLQNKEGLE